MNWGRLGWIGLGKAGHELLTPPVFSKLTFATVPTVILGSYSGVSGCVQLTEAIVEMMKANLGITVLANWAVQPYARTKQLASLPLLSDPKVRTWYVALTTPSDPVMGLFLTCLQQRVGRKLAVAIT